MVTKTFSDVRKLVRIGNSYGVTLPNDLRAQLKLQAGDRVEIVFRKYGVTEI